MSKDLAGLNLKNTEIQQNQKYRHVLIGDKEHYCWDTACDQEGYPQTRLRFELDPSHRRRLRAYLVGFLSDSFNSL